MTGRAQIVAGGHGLFGLIIQRKASDKNVHKKEPYGQTFKGLAWLS